MAERAIGSTIKAVIGMVAMFAAAILGVMYLFGGIGDGVGLFAEASDEPTVQADRRPGRGGGQTSGTFDDDDGNDAEPEIEAAVLAGAMSGCGGEGARTFCPDEPITRADFAVALDVAVEPPEADTTFEDVPADAPYAGAVARLAADGVISGCGETRFCPDDPVTRGQAAALVSRTLDLPGDVVQTFEDVPADSSFATVIGQMAAQGLMDPCVSVPAQFCPGESLTRADAAALLVRSGLVS